MTQQSCGGYVPDNLTPWQREVLERITKLERVVLSMPHRQGRSSAYDIAETCCGKCPGGTCYVDQVTGA